MPPVKYYNLMVVPDGVEHPIGIRMRAWMFKILVTLFAFFIVGVILFFIFYGKIVARAAMATKLEEENQLLKRYKYKVTLLEERMREAREYVGRISELAGVDFNLPDMPPDSIIFADRQKPAAAVIAHAVAADGSLPRGLPLHGYMTRGFMDDSAHYHPGIDIAIGIGTPVLATASGVVAHTGQDSVYGLIVEISHRNGISTVYAHNSELLVQKGDSIMAGKRIALSGNTGKSTAPHLHYEIRENDKPVNPLKYIDYHEESNEQN